MKKFYLITAITLGFICIAGSAKAQTTYETDPAYCASGCSLFDAGSWLPPNGEPPIQCGNCKITINGIVSVDFSGFVLYNNSQVIVTANSTLSVDARVVVKDNTQILIGNDATSPAHLIMTAEADLFTNSYVQLANSNTDIDASTTYYNSDDSLAGPPGNLGSGLYYVTGPTTYNVLLCSFGYGDPASLQSPYFLPNCAPSGCFDGVVIGPVTSGFSGPPDNLYEFLVSPTLPVVLLQFAASVNNDKTVLLSWATSQETNSDYFELQRSADGNNFQPIGKVKSKGFSSIITNYSFTDTHPLNSVNYYRLKMVDQDTKFEFSKVITVTLDGKTAPLVVYNNPFKDQIRIKLNTSASDNLSLILTDVQGKTYLRQSYKAQPGDNFINIYPPAAASGLYILSIKGSRVSQTVKLLKQ